MGMQAMGRTFNWQFLCDGVYINMKNATGIAFLCYLAGAVGDTYTLVEARDAAGTGAQNLVTITEYWTCTGNASDTWTKRLQSPSAVVVTAATATQNCMVCEVQGVELSDGYKYVKLTSTGAGIVTALHTGPVVQRTPGNLVAMGV